MPEKRTIERARRATREGKAPTTVAGEFVREEKEHVKRGKHGVKNPRQAIAIGLSKARRAGVDLPPPERGEANESTRRSAKRAYEKGQAEGELAGGTRKRSSTKSDARTSPRAKGKPAAAGRKRGGSASRTTGGASTKSRTGGGTTKSRTTSGGSAKSRTSAGGSRGKRPTRTRSSRSK